MSEEKDFDSLRVLAKTSLSAFASVMHHDWQPNWHHRVIARALERMASGEPGWDRLIISLPPRSGKALAIGTPILTPNGFKTIGELAPGDMVFAIDGTPTRVVAKSQVWKDRPVWKVSVGDGSYVIADAEHEWVVRLKEQGAGVVKTTAYLAEHTSDINPKLEDERYISFEPAGVADTVCIQVEHPSHQFLAGTGLIPTHNSELISRMFPGWYMSTHPHENVIVATYGAELADDLGRKAREYAATELFESIMGTTVSRDTNAITKWELANRSGFFATSVGGALTGRGADCLIIDDPVKNREDAESEMSLEKTFAWFTSTAYSRLEKNGKVVIVMTRWSEMDLAGRLIASNSGWRELTFPAIAEIDDDYRLVGAPLWPDKYPLERLYEIKRTVGLRDWASLYQQRPAPAEGNIFRAEWFKYYSSPQELFASDKIITGVYQSWDTAVSAKKTSARSACTTWVVVDNREFYLVDIFAEPLAFPELRQKAIDLYNKWKPHTIFVEEQQTGRPLIDELRRTLGDKLVPVRLRGDKEVRARAASVAFETGRVFLPEQASWVDDYTNMLMTFPSGRFIDLVDSTSQAIIKLLKDLNPRRQQATPSGALEALNIPIRSVFKR